MEEWKEFRLEQVGKITTGKTPKTAIKEYFGGDICFITPADINTPYKYVNETGRYLTNEGLNSILSNSIDKGSICVSCIGNIGYAGIVKMKCASNQQINSITVNQEFDRDFIYYSIKNLWSFFKNYEGQSTTLSILNKGQFSKISIKCPSFETQKYIAAILSSLDDKIEVNRRINENLEQQAQALFKSWFVDFEPFKDGEFEDSELGMIPKGWRVGILDELCSFISRGLTPKYDETSEELILGQTCVRNNIVTLNNARKHRPKAKNDKWVQQWDVLLNSTGIGSLGRVGIVYFNMDNVAIDSHITVVRTSCPLYRHYVGRNLLSRQLEIENMAVGSTGQTELPRDRVKAMPIIIPSHDVMDKFNAIIEPMAISMYSNIIESRRLAELRDSLLPKLMSGEIKVLHTDLINEMLEKGIR